MTYSVDTPAQGTGSIQLAKVTLSAAPAAYSAQASAEAYFGTTSAGQACISATGFDLFDLGGFGKYDQGGVQYVPQAAGQSSTVTVHVDAQQNTTPSSVAGLVMRSDLTAMGNSLDFAQRAPAYIALVATPSQGVALEWDSKYTAPSNSTYEGDGVLDQRISTGAGSLTAPIWLRLQRTLGSNGHALYVGSYSSDGHAWTNVNNILPVDLGLVGSGAQDVPTNHHVGMIDSAVTHDSTSASRSLACFSQFSVTSP